jgi:hypothetical protein
MDKCILCEANLFETSVKVSEGLMCEDSLGCRRRALKRLEGLTERPNTLRQREGDQPLPVVNDEKSIQDQVIEDILARKELGISRYGTALQPFNGRDAFQDLYDELIDATQYIKQCLVERSKEVK